jgi:hypothetical protein
MSVEPAPEEESVVLGVAVPTLGPDRGGFGSRLGLSGYRTAEDEIIPEEEMP